MPPANWAGFGPADLIELALAMLLAVLALTSREWIEPWAAKLAAHARVSMLLLAALPIVLRLALLPNHPVPLPVSSDEFAHLLTADTLRHFRLANPALSLPQFFETRLVLQQPSYSSIQPLGQGIVLALGRLISGLPWAGVLVAAAAFCALSYWMLSSWVEPVWALLGGLLAVIEFGPLSQWTNTYSGGALPAAAGCLVFGALPRLRDSPRTGTAVWLGLGLAILVITSPYEALLILAGVALFLAAPGHQWGKPPGLLTKHGAQPVTRKLGRLLLIVAAVMLPAVGLSLAQNRQATGRWTTSPAAASRTRYGVPAALTFDANPVPEGPLTPQQQLDYRAQMSARPAGGETVLSYLLRLEYRVRFYRFFFLPALYLTLLAFLATLHELRFAWVALMLAIFSLGVNFDPVFDLSAFGAVAPLFLLVSVVGLRQWTRWLSWGGRDAAWIVLALCLAHFLLWYGVHLFDNAPFARALMPYETWDVINHSSPNTRAAIEAQLDQQPGRQVVFVRYVPQHLFPDEWVYNAADPGAARIVWARDLGPQEDRRLMDAFPGRTAWLVEPDSRPPRLTPYPF